MLTATLVKYLKGNRKNPWFKGTALYRLSEPKELSVMGFLTATDYVIVAVTPRAVDHGRPETTIFAANKNGSLFGGFWDRESENLEDHWYINRVTLEDGEFERCRIVGRHDHKAALAKLGYHLRGTT